MRGRGLVFSVTAQSDAKDTPHSVAFSILGPLSLCELCTPSPAVGDEEGFGVRLQMSTLAKPQQTGSQPPQVLAGDTTHLGPFRKSFVTEAVS